MPRGAGRLVLMAALTAGCVREPAARAPAASFLVDAGDSTFWVQSGDSAPSVRRSSLLLARLDGRLHEIYVMDDDRSFYDAILVGQRIYRRDLVSGDSTLLFEDPSIAQLARDYQAAHPDESPLAPDEDASDDPATSATTDTELLDVLGPYLNIERHIDYDLASGRELHLVRRGVIDLRTGRAVRVGDLAATSVVASVLRQARTSMAAVRDSVRRSADERARMAATTLGGFQFDSTSFSLEVEAGRPALVFVVPGRGRRAAGYTLPLPPVAFEAGTWWEEARQSLPTDATDSTDVWRGSRYDVVAHYDAGADMAHVSLRRGNDREYPVGVLPTPVLRVYRLDALDADSAAMAALARAFAEADESADDAHTALLVRPTPARPAAGRPGLRP